MERAELRAQIVGAIYREAEAIAAKVVHPLAAPAGKGDGPGQGSGLKRAQTADLIFTSRWTAFPLMALLLALVLWITIVGANYPSQLLATALFWVQDQLAALATSWQFPWWLKGVLVDGIYRTVAWVVSVMLPPMAIFFPCFALLEDWGLLPRIAFNLDRIFKACGTCGKQALTMSMGLGCNAAGVVSCRIIDSPRERLIAMLTNSFIPCNGRFPTLIALSATFFAGGPSWHQTLLPTLAATGMILVGVGATLGVSWLLSKTLLRGLPSYFILELPPYRRPQVLRTIVRSMLDRTWFVLARAVMVAAPAGAVIWLLANFPASSPSLLSSWAGHLDPLGRALGLDGFILVAFILGLPANEIVLPLALMGYLAGTSMMEYSGLTELHTVLVEHGWTWITALCTLLFSVLHYPCATTLLTIKKESQSAKWTLLAGLVPLAAAMLVCFVANQIL